MVIDVNHNPYEQYHNTDILVSIIHFDQYQLSQHLILPIHDNIICQGQGSV